MTLLRCIQVLPRRSELTDLAGHSLAGPERWLATLCRPLSSYTSHASNLVTA